jgi:uncharacterized membrane protein
VSSRLARLLRHAFTTPGALRRAFGADALERIQQAIGATEARHSGEIRFAVESTLPWSYLWRNAPARERALMVFAKLRVWDTEANNGVLIYLELADRCVEIVADRGIARHVPPAGWDSILQGMREHFRRGEFEAGAIEGIEGVGDLLARHFPLAPDAPNPDELPNRPAVL